MSKLKKGDRPQKRALKIDEIISKYPEAVRIILRELLMKLEKLEIDKDWLPTPENINALAEPVRKFIHDIETNTDPALTVRENILIKDTCRALVIKLDEKKPKFTEQWIKEKAEDLVQFAYAITRTEPDAKEHRVNLKFGEGIIRLLVKEIQGN